MMRDGPEVMDQIFVKNHSFSAALDACINFNSFGTQRCTITNEDVAFEKGAGCCT